VEKPSKFIKTSWDEHQRKLRIKAKRRKKKEAEEMKKFKELEAERKKLQSYEGLMDKEEDMVLFPNSFHPSLSLISCVENLVDFNSPTFGDRCRTKI
jgi:hypothetical protein